MSERVSFQSDGLKLAGVLHAADGDSSGRRRPGFLVLHGFGSNKDSGGSVATATMLAERGYVALRFDMRGCGESEGSRGRVICLEQASRSNGPRARVARPPAAERASLDAYVK